MKVRIEVVIAAILILCVAFGLDKWSSTRRLANQTAVIDSLALANQTLRVELNKSKEAIYTQTVLVTDNQNTIKELTDSIFNLKRSQARKVKEVETYWREHTSTRIDSFEAGWVDTIAMRKFADSVEKQCASVLSYMRDSTITVPRTVKADSSFFNYDVTVGKNGLTFNKIEFPDRLDVRFVEKGGFLKKRSIEVQFKHSNPNVKVEGSSSVYYNKPYKKRWFVKALIFGAGIFVGLKL